MVIKRDNCKDCHSECEHAGKDREFVCINGISCKIKKGKPQTNADRIRSMSDEELAVKLNAFIEYFDECNRSDSEVECKDCELYELCCLGDGNALGWLKQPVKDGA